MEKNNIKPWYDTKQYNYVSLLQIMILINFLYFSYFISFDCIHSIAFLLTLSSCNQFAQFVSNLL